MKKVFALILSLGIGFSVAQADIKYVTGSFKRTNVTDIAAGGTELGSKNMTSTLADYAPSHDDDQIKSAIIRVNFLNLANENIENHMDASVNPGFVNRTEYRKNANGAIEYWVHVDPSDDLLLTLALDGIGSTRIPNLKVQSGNMYALSIETDEMVPVTFSSNVDGTEIIFDGQPIGGRTGKEVNVTKDKTTMGNHKVIAIANGFKKEFEIEVTKVNTHFTVDMLRKYTIDFSSNEPGVSLYEGDKVVCTLPSSIEVPEGPHSYIVKKNGYDDVPYNVNITGPQQLKFEIHKSKTIDFYAILNNSDYSGASVYINNELRGSTPLQLSLPYGKYNVRMSVYDRDKSSKLTVDDNTSSRYMLKLPAHHRRFNPFNIDFNKREVGITFAYVQKWMYFSDGRSSESGNYFGENKHMNGMQIGIPVQPIFGYGMGLNTGLFYEVYFDDYNDGDKINLVEHNLYLPVDFMFRLPLGENFSIYVNGGVGIDWSIETVLSIDGYQDYKIDYDDEGAPNHFNFSGEFGGGIQFKALQLSANYQIGLNNNKNMVYGDLTAKLRKFSVQLSIMF